MKTTLLKNILTFCVLVFTVGALSAQNVITWTGAVDSSFVNSANWNPAAIPDGSSDVVIDSTLIKAFYTADLVSAGNSDNFISHLTGDYRVPFTVSAPMLIGGGSGNYFGGNLTLTTGGDINIRNQGRFGQSGNASVININDGVLNTKNQLIIGDGGDCTFNINGGLVTSTANGIILGGYAGLGVLNLNGGELIVNGGFPIDENATTTGDYLFINGGVLTMPGDNITWANDYVASGKIRSRVSEQIIAFLNGTSDTTTVGAVDPGNAITWTGAIDSDFANPGNWDLGIVPNDTDDVTIGTSANAPVFNTALIEIDPINKFQDRGAISHLYGVPGTPITINAHLSIYGGSGNYMGGDLNIGDGGLIEVRNQARFGQTDNSSIVNINTGGRIFAKNYFILADNGDCEFNINGGELDATGQGIILGGYNGYAVLNVNAGEVKVNSFAIDDRADRPGGGYVTVDNGQITMAGDQTVWAADYVAAGKIIAAPGKEIVVTTNSTGPLDPITETYINAAAITAKNVLYVNQSGVGQGAGASAPGADPVITMLQSDANFNVTYIEVPQDGTGIDLTGYDLVIAQETISSGAAMFQPGGILGVKDVTVPIIYNKSWAFRNGKAVTDADAAVTGTQNLVVTVDPANQTNTLFRGISFAGGNDVQIFASATANDDGSTGGNKAIDVLNDLEISDVAGGTLATTPEVTDAAKSIVINHIPAGTQLGEAATDVLTVDAVALSFSYGATILGDGTNVSSEALTIWRNAAYTLTGLAVPNTLYVNADFTLGIEDKASLVSTDVYAIGDRIYVSNVKSTSEVNIYSITGALVKSFKTNEDTNFNFKSGLWIATVKTYEGAKSVKLLTK